MCKLFSDPPLLVYVFSGHFTWVIGPRLQNDGPVTLNQFEDVMKSSKVCVMTGSTGWNVTAWCWVIFGSYFPKLARRSAPFVPHSQYGNSVSSTAISFEMRSYPILYQAPILNGYNGIGFQTCSTFWTTIPSLLALIRLYSMCTTSIPFLIRFSSFYSRSAERSANQPFSWGHISTARWPCYRALRISSVIAAFW